MKGGEVVLKTDGLGRVKTPVARRESLLDEFERTGLSGAKFAALAGIKYQTFAAWAELFVGRGLHVRSTDCATVSRRVEAQRREIAWTIRKQAFVCCG